MVRTISQQTPPGSGSTLGRGLVVTGTSSRNDALRGTPSNYAIRGLACNDILLGSAGKDVLLGGTGNAIINSADG